MAVSINRSAVVRTSQWRTGAYAVQHFMEYNGAGHAAARAFIAGLGPAWHLHHMTGDGWALRDLTANGSTFNWATSGNRRGLDPLDAGIWTQFAADNPACDFILVAHAYTSFITGADNNNGRPGSNAEAQQFADIVAEVLDRYPGRYFAVMYGQELKGGYSRSNPAEFIGHFNAFSVRLKSLHPTIKVIGPHMGFYGYSNSGADIYSQRTADMNALLASTDGTTEIDSGHNGGEEDAWLYAFIDQCWANFDYLGLDVSIIDINDTVALGRVGNWSHIRDRVKLLEAMQRRAEWMMLDTHGATKPIYWSEKYIDVNISTHPPEYTEDEQAVGMVLLDLYAAQGRGLSQGAIGTNVWQPEGGNTTASANNYAWFSDCDTTVTYPTGGSARPPGSIFKHGTYIKEIADRFSAGQTFVDCESDTPTIHPFCNGAGEYIIFNTDTVDATIPVTDEVTGQTRQLTIPAIGRLTGTLPFPQGTSGITQVQDWKSNLVQSGASVSIGAAQGWSTPTPGHVLLLAVESNQNATINITHDLPAGWTLLKSEPGGAGAAGTRAPIISVYGKIADGTESTITVTTQGGSTRHSLQVTELAGAADPLELDGTPTSSTTSNAAATSLASGALTTIEDDSYVVAVYAAETGLTFTNPAGSGYDQNAVASEGGASFNSLTVAIFDKAQTVAGPTSITPTTSLSRQISSVQVAIKKEPPPAGITGPFHVGGFTSILNTTVAEVTIGAGGIPAGALVLLYDTIHNTSIAIDDVETVKAGVVVDTATVTADLDVSTVLRNNGAYVRLTQALAQGDKLRLTFTGATSRPCFGICYFLGASGTPRSATGATSNGTGNTVTAGAATPTVAGDLVVSFVSMRLAADQADSGLVPSVGLEATEVACNAPNSNRAASLLYTVAPSTSPITHAGTATQIGASNQWATRTLIFPVQAAPSPPANTVAPAITGSTGTGQTLSCSTGTWNNTPTAYAYQWRRNGAPINGATTSTYVLQAADAGSSITCAVTASNADGSASATSNTQAIPAAPANTVAPVVSGTPAVGQTLSATTGTWSGSPSYAYQWRRGSENIDGATSSTYVVQSLDSGTTVTCVVTGSNANGSAAAASNGLAIPSIAGAVVGGGPRTAIGTNPRRPRGGARIRPGR